MTICILYIIIFYRVKQATKHATLLMNNNHHEKRDLELLRNIMILLGIYFLGGLPSVLFVMTGNRWIYLISIVSMSFTVAIEKISMIILDRDIRQVTKSLICRRTRVVPFQLETTRR